MGTSRLSYWRNSATPRRDLRQQRTVMSPAQVTVWSPSGPSGQTVARFVIIQHRNTAKRNTIFFLLEIMSSKTYLHDLLRIKWKQLGRSHSLLLLLRPERTSGPHGRLDSLGHFSLLVGIYSGRRGNPISVSPDMKATLHASPPRLLVYSLVFPASCLHLAWILDNMSKYRGAGREAEE